MSYDIYLKHPVTGETLELDEPHHMHGGTFCVGGTTRAHLNVTYNYAPFYYEHIDSMRGIRAIYGKTGAESLELLQRGVDALGDDVSDRYWDATEGNAKAALLQLIALANMRPDGIWDGD